MTPADLSRTVLSALRRAVDEGVLAGPVPDSVQVGRPGPGGSGDYATSVALRLAGPARRSPRDIAEILRAEILRSTPDLSRVDVTGPGFLNFTLAPAAAPESSAPSSAPGSGTDTGTPSQAPP